MIKILKLNTHQVRKMKNGDKTVVSKSVEISGFRVKDSVNITLIGENFIHIKTRKTQ